MYNNLNFFRVEYMKHITYLFQLNQLIFTEKSV